MGRLEKAAWINIAAGGLALVGVLVMWLIFGSKGMMAGAGFLGLAGLEGLVGRKQPYDERDKSINRLAMAQSGLAAYLTFLVGSMGVWVYGRMTGIESIPLETPITIMWWSWIMLVLFRGLVLLIVIKKHSAAECV